MLPLQGCKEIARNAAIHGENNPANCIYEVVSEAVRTCRTLVDGRRQSRSSEPGSCGFLPLPSIRGRRTRVAAFGTTGGQQLATQPTQPRHSLLNARAETSACPASSPAAPAFGRTIGQPAAIQNISCQGQVDVRRDQRLESLSHLRVFALATLRPALRQVALLDQVSEQLGIGPVGDAQEIVEALGRGARARRQNGLR